ncbi:M23 family metallopeptidase [Sphingomonas parva]|uniref:M23 family metallopeptidase n=1 Tax=Sphingomonas parva TaxID=2555898 RepID=A0A4Y8ZRJ7_9SPHN|nr:M23 family metallopeptidase [Sphingomonas parva]TFI57409.1 M23 family metallopeptidase [Sphingomonas parva]
MVLTMVSALLLQGAAPAAPRAAFEEPPAAQEPAGEIEAVLIAPLFAGMFVCGEHAAGEPTVVGDALGTDCQVIGRDDEGFRRFYRTDGKRNEDWYSWGAEVLAPFDGTVTGLFPNDRVNAPGTRGRPPAGMLQMRRADGLTVVYAHVRDFAVAVGDRITAGQVVARVGNNGPSYAPHVHAGAYRGVVPLQIRWDQRAMWKALRAAAAAETAPVVKK